MLYSLWRLMGLGSAGGCACGRRGDQRTGGTLEAVVKTGLHFLIPEVMTRQARLCLREPLFLFLFLAVSDVHTKFISFSDCQAASLTNASFFYYSSLDHKQKVKFHPNFSHPAPRQGVIPNHPLLSFSVPL